MPSSSAVRECAGTLVAKFRAYSWRYVLVAEIRPGDDVLGERLVLPCEDGGVMDAVIRLRHASES
jgi:hypothetical protein